MEVLALIILCTSATVAIIGNGLFTWIILGLKKRKSKSKKPKVIVDDLESGYQSHES